MRCGEAVHGGSGSRSRGSSVAASAAAANTTPAVEAVDAADDGRVRLFLCVNAHAGSSSRRHACRRVVREAQLVEAAVAGEDAFVFAYGAAQSGKTCWLLGSRFADAVQRKCSSHPTSTAYVTDVHEHDDGNDDATAIASTATPLATPTRAAANAAATCNNEVAPRHSTSSSNGGGRGCDVDDNIDEDVAAVQRAAVAAKAATYGSDVCCSQPASKLVHDKDDKDDDGLLCHFVMSLLQRRAREHVAAGTTGTTTTAAAATAAADMHVYVSALEHVHGEWCDLLGRELNNVHDTTDARFVPVTTREQLQRVLRVSCGRRVERFVPHLTSSLSHAIVQVRCVTATRCATITFADLAGCAVAADEARSDAAPSDVARLQLSLALLRQHALYVCGAPLPPQAAAATTTAAAATTTTAQAVDGGGGGGGIAATMATVERVAQRTFVMCYDQKQQQQQLQQQPPVWRERWLRFLCCAMGNDVYTTTSRRRRLVGLFMLPANMLAAAAQAACAAAATASNVTAEGRSARAVRVPCRGGSSAAAAAAAAASRALALHGDGYASGTTSSARCGSNSASSSHGSRCGGVSAASARPQHTTHGVVVAAASLHTLQLACQMRNACMAVAAAAPRMCATACDDVNKSSGSEQRVTCAATPVPLVLLACSDDGDVAASVQRLHTTCDEADTTAVVAGAVCTSSATAVTATMQQCSGDTVSHAGDDANSDGDRSRHATPATALTHISLRQLLREPATTTAAATATDAAPPHAVLRIHKPAPYRVQRVERHVAAAATSAATGNAVAQAGACGTTSVHAGRAAGHAHTQPDTDSARHAADCARDATQQASTHAHHASLCSVSSESSTEARDNTDNSSSNNNNNNDCSHKMMQQTRHLCDGYGGGGGRCGGDDDSSHRCTTNPHHLPELGASARFAAVSSCCTAPTHTNMAAATLSSSLDTYAGGDKHGHMSHNINADGSSSRRKRSGKDTRTTALIASAPTEVLRPSTHTLSLVMNAASSTRYGVVRLSRTTGATTMTTTPAATTRAMTKTASFVANAAGGRLCARSASGDAVRQPGSRLPPRKATTQQQQQQQQHYVRQAHDMHDGGAYNVGETIEGRRNRILHQARLDALQKHETRARRHLEAAALQHATALVLRATAASCALHASRKTATAPHYTITIR